MSFRSENLLITGGAGFIGSNFINYLFSKNKKIKVFNLDSLTYAGNIKNTNNFKQNPNYKFINGDITDSNLLIDIFQKYKIDGIINFAAESHVDNSIINPEIFIRTNVNGVFNLLKVAYSSWMDKPFSCKKGYYKSRFHQISTDEVYGSIDGKSVNEKNKYAPNSPYSASKASADMLVRSFNKTFGLNTTISICSNNYGPNQHEEKFIPKIINSINKNIPITVFGNGKNIRDWIYVDDHCKAIELIFNQSREGETYNIGASNELSNLELIKIISKILEKKYEIEFIEDRYGHDKRYSLNSDKIKNEFNWDVEDNFENNIKKFLK
tara:strand:- start:63 stop:1034 length:972 start_codon:yes stop_codon:yes gene_type:complete